MWTATLPRGMSRALVVGLAAGAAAFALLTATGRASSPFRAGDEARQHEPRPNEGPGLPNESPRPAGGDDVAALRQGPPVTAVADPRQPTRRRDSREPPAAVDRPTGSTSAIPAVAPQGITATGPELQQSRGEITAIEQQLARARAEVQLRLQQDLNDEVAAIRLLLAQEQARSYAQSAAAQEDRATKEAAVNTLLTAQARLATGDRHVLDVIEDASPTLPAPAQRAVERARMAIRSEDLYNARYWLAIAIAETQRVLPGP